MRSAVLADSCRGAVGCGEGPAGLFGCLDRTHRRWNAVPLGSRTTEGSSGRPHRDRDASPNARQLLRGDARAGGIHAMQRHAGDVVRQRPACRIGAVVSRRFNPLRQRPVRESFIPSQRNHERVRVLLRKQLVILDDYRRTKLARLLGQGATAPINHHDASRRVAAHGKSVSGVPSWSSSLRASACLARWATTRLPSARIAARRTRRASASAISRTNALSPLPFPRAAASSTARSSASSRIVSV